jgi:hypothetical protein
MLAVASPPKSRLPESAPTAARLDHQAAGFVQHWIGVALVHYDPVPDHSHRESPRSVAE